MLILFSDEVMIAKILTCKYVCMNAFTLIVIECNYSFSSDLVDF
jgi:hypothetical protein